MLADLRAKEALVGVLRTPRQVGLTMENGSGSRFQNAPFHPDKEACSISSCSASSIPEVWVARWRIVIRLFSGSPRHAGMYLDARSAIPGLLYA